MPVKSPFTTEERIWIVKQFKQKVGPLLRRSATKNQLYFMQGGATCHTIPSNLEFLLNKFNGRLISNKTDIARRIVPKLN